MIIDLSVGSYIANTRPLIDARVQHWKYKNECALLGGEFVVNTKWQVVEVNKIPGSMWVKVEVPNSYGRTLKISGEEFAHCFKMS
jgi:hypothetical protein